MRSEIDSVLSLVVFGSTINFVASENPAKDKIRSNFATRYKIRIATVYFNKYRVLSNVLCVINDDAAG